MLKIKNLNKNFGQKKVLRNLNAEFKTGLNFILGPSGSGKSTLLKIISGMDEDYSGLVTYKGRALNSLSYNEKNSYYFNSIGFIWQNFGLIDHLSVEDNVKLVLELTDDNKEIMGKKVQVILRKLGIEKLAKESIKTLSGGQKQRVAIARVLVKEPEVIIADEPTGALDKRTSKVIMTILKKISEERLVIIVTHDTSLIQEDCNVFTLTEGSLLKVKESTSKEFVREKKKYIIPKLSLKNAAYLGLKNFKGLLFKRILVSVVLTLSAFFILLNTSGEVVSKQNEILNNLIEKKGKLLREIQLPASAVSASGTGENGNKEGNINIKQDPSRILSKYINDPRMDYVIPMEIVDDMIISIEEANKEFKVTSSGAYPHFNDLVAGRLPKLEGREVAVTNAFLKKNNLKSEDVIGKTISIKGNKFEWSTGEPKPVDIEINDLKVVGVTDSSVEFNAPNGEKIENELEDSFIYSMEVIKEIKEKSNNAEDGITINLRVKDVKDIMPIVEELNKEGLTPLGEFESVKDILKISDVSKEGAKSITTVISILGIVITFIITLITSHLRKYEFAVLKINGFSKMSMFKLNIMEGVFLSLASILILGVIFIPINSLALKYFSIGLSGVNTILMGIGIIVLLGLLSSIISYFMTLKASISENLMTGDK
ncbi:ATP-binding cassette domain-containing protein [Clostridium perfringens]|nr:ATP-binding cassette domain-containing protein [Clostridium perfringens]